MATLVSIVAGMLLAPLAYPQTADFQIVWINVGEVASAAGKDRTKAGSQLFMAPDLVEFSLKKVTVANVAVEPTVIQIDVGDRFCLTSLQVHALGEDRVPIKGAPLTVSVRQDQRERLAIVRGKRNICFRPTSEGEYPVRLNSLLPARDGTTRGAQIFIRVSRRHAESRADRASRAGPEILGSLTLDQPWNSVRAQSFVISPYATK